MLSGPGPAIATRFIAAIAAPSSRLSFSDFIFIVSNGVVFLRSRVSQLTCSTSVALGDPATHPPGNTAHFLGTRFARQPPGAMDINPAWRLGLRRPQWERCAILAR